MIYGNINNLEEYSFLPSNIQKCFNYIKNNDLENFENGAYEIDGKNIFFNIIEFETTLRDEKFWEAHKEYLDIHFILSDEEMIDINFLENLDELEFIEESDFLKLDGNVKSSIILEKGDFLICYPKDGHKPGLKVGKIKQIKKAIFKVKL